MKKVVSNVVMVIFFAWVIYFVYQQREDFYKITTISFAHLLPTLLLVFCSYVVNGNFLRLMLKKYSIAISLQESTSLAILTTFFNTLMPMQSGAALRAVYLKKKYNFDYTSFLVTLYAIYVVVLFNVACIGIAVTILIYIKYGIVNVFVTAILAALFLVLGIIYFIPIEIPIQKRRILQLIKTSIDNWNQLRLDRTLIVKLQFQQLINFTLRTAVMCLIFFSMGISLPIEKVMYFQIVASIMFIVNITPGAIGIQETLFLFVGKLLLIPMADVLIMALLLRSVSLSVNIVSAPFASYSLFEKSLFDLKKELL